MVSQNGPASQEKARGKVGAPPQMRRVDAGPATTASSSNSIMIFSFKLRPGGYGMRYHIGGIATYSYRIRNKTLHSVTPIVIRCRIV
jgi:hypothetical protein